MPKTKNEIYYFENENISLKKRKLTVKKTNIVISLSKNQSVFLWCLIQGVTNKKDIIESVWPDCDWRSKDNNYRQIIYQTRILLRRGGLDNSLHIISKNSLCLDMNITSTNATIQNIDTRKYNDPGIINFWE
ncbi:Uncharacterised protein [Serratia quinivorans]|nr:Uncharacterised protein [Serratia quinivorans]CAI1144282.1 Uncharacterised protein [Serratia quinivorans]CAI2131156.1 Uncharacterised protein [Serratia quinivorans]